MGMDPQHTAAIGHVRGINASENKDFETIVRSLLANFKSLSWTKSNISLPYDLTKPNLKFLIDEATRNGFSTSVSRFDRSLCISKSSAVDLSFLQLTPLSEHLIQYLYLQTQMRSKNVPLACHLNQSFKLEGGMGSKLQVNKQWKIPKSKITKTLDQAVESLPIHKYKKEILNAVTLNPLTLVKGESGCGKSTQVPQFILDEAASLNKRAQIIATVTQRVSAILIAERIASERGEDIGSSIGYQVRLESKISPCDTVLTFCTNEILLRSLAQPDYEVLKNTTHIIIDDINERDPYMDFLLTCLRDLLPSFPNLRIILMGADIHLEDLIGFFGSHIVTISINKLYYPVKTYYLEDIIKMTAAVLQTNQDSESSTSSPDGYDHQMLLKQYKLRINCLKYFDGLLEKVFKFGCEDSAAKLTNLIISRRIPVNYQHSVTRISILSCFAARGFLQEVKLLLKIGADDEQTSEMKTRKSLVGRFTARDFAVQSKHKDVIDQFTENQYARILCKSVDYGQNPEISELLLQSFDYSPTTHISKIIYKIHKEEDCSGAILVFLKDYDEIIQVMNKLLHSASLIKNEFCVFVIHPVMQTGDQKGVFQPLSEGVRKVILATSIAETSLSFSDVSFVIDSGKYSKKICSDSNTEDDDGIQWISKSSANQRKSLAGCNSPGKCFRVYSVAQYESFSEYAVPEIITTSLMNLCLLSRSLIRSETKIERFFSQLPSPPDLSKVSKTVRLLQVIEALDDNETLTDLGNHMIDYPIEPQLAKALFYGVVMKCLDPVLTIVATLHHGDPFLNSATENEKYQSVQYKRILGSRQLSDHYAYVKLFQEWEKEASSKNGIQFCTKWGLRVTTFEKICTSRTMLLGQLRASGFVKNDIRELNRHSKYWVVVKAVLTAARYPNIARIHRSSETISLGYQNKVDLHPSTILLGGEIPELKSDWIIFDESTNSHSQKQIKGCTIVTPTCIALFGGGIFRIVDVDQRIKENFKQKQPFFPNYMALQIGEIVLSGTASSVQSIAQLRVHLKRLVSKILGCPLGPTSGIDAELVKTVAEILSNEECKIGLENVDVSQWPRFVGANMMTLPQIGLKNANFASNSACLYSV